MKKLISILVIMLYSSIGYCEVIPNWNALADAIYKAEGGVKTNHPYGIMVKYKHTTPRQACINTIKHKWRDYNDQKIKGQTFLEYLASRYAPIGAENDPTNLNKNWLKNVSKFYKG